MKLLLKNPTDRDIASAVRAFFHQLSRGRGAKRDRQPFSSPAQAEHQHLNEVVSNVPGIVWETLLDPVTNKPITTFISDYVEKMLGYTAREWLSSPPGFGLRIMVADEDREKSARDSEEVIRTGKEGVSQFRWKAKDGRILWIESYLGPIIDEDGKIVGLRGVSIDITERKHVEQEMRASEANYRAVFNAANDAIFIHDLDTGSILDVNQRMCEMYGVTVEEARSLTVGDLSSNEAAYTQENAITWIRRAAGNGPQLFEWQAKHKSGRLFLVEVNLKRAFLDGRNVLLAVVRDITERKLAQEALRQSEEKFRNMADIAPVMIWVSGADKLCTYVNKNWLDFTGRSLEQELGNGWAEGVHPDDYAHCLEVYHQAFDRLESFKMEYRLRRSDGAYRWVLDCATPRFSSDGEFLGYIGSCMDITERKESEVALRTAHDELNELKNRLQAENIYLHEELQLDHTFGELVGQSDAIKYVLFKISQVAPTDSTVLIMGETGTGKELVARAIHGSSLRKDRPLIKVNCAALSTNLIESELFGHEKGAFTGAGARKLGRFELADGGTIFLDEIGELPLESQVKLLRVIQEGELERLGGTKTIKVDVRIIAATNRDLKVGVEKGTFRQDLWYRLHVFPITVPPLRQRKEDIPLLVEHFTNKSAKKFGKKISSVSAGTMRKLQDHSWPGNVRELANVIERAAIHTQGNVLHLVDRFEPTPEELPSSTMSLEEMEREYIIRTLENTGWRIEGPYGAAKILGLNPSTLRTRMAKLQIQRRSARFA